MSFVILTADVVDVDDVGVVVDVVGNVVVGGVGVEDVGVGLVAPDQSAILEETLAWWCSVLTKWPDWWEVAVLLSSPLASPVSPVRISSQQKIRIIIRIRKDSRRN